MFIWQNIATSLGPFFIKWRFVFFALVISTRHSRLVWLIQLFMMTSSNGNIFRVTGLCAGNSPVPVNSPHKGQWRGALMFSLICVWINGWVNKREAGDLRRHRGHHDVIVMWKLLHWHQAISHVFPAAVNPILSCTYYGLLLWQLTDKKSFISHTYLIKRLVP